MSRAAVLQHGLLLTLRLQQPATPEGVFYRRYSSKNIGSAETESQLRTRSSPAPRTAEPDVGRSSSADDATTSLSDPLKNFQSWRNHDKSLKEELPFLKASFGLVGGSRDSRKDHSSRWEGPSRLRLDGSSKPVRASGGFRCEERSRTSGAPPSRLEPPAFLADLVQPSTQEHQDLESCTKTFVAALSKDSADLESLQLHIRDLRHALRYLFPDPSPRFWRSKSITFHRTLHTLGKGLLEALEALREHKIITPSKRLSKTFDPVVISLAICDNRHSPSFPSAPQKSDPASQTENVGTDSNSTTPAILTLYELFTRMDALGLALSEVQFNVVVRYLSGDGEPHTLEKNIYLPKRARPSMETLRKAAETWEQRLTLVKILQKEYNHRRGNEIVIADIITTSLRDAKRLGPGPFSITWSSTLQRLIADLLQIRDTAQLKWKSKLSPLTTRWKKLDTERKSQHIEAANDLQGRLIQSITRNLLLPDRLQNPFDAKPEDDFPDISDARHLLQLLLGSTSDQNEDGTSTPPRTSSYALESCLLQLRHFTYSNRRQEDLLKIIQLLMKHPNVPAMNGRVHSSLLTAAADQAQFRQILPLLCEFPAPCSPAIIRRPALRLLCRFARHSSLEDLVQSDVESNLVKQIITSDGWLGLLRYTLQRWGFRLNEKEYEELLLARATDSQSEVKRLEDVQRSRLDQINRLHPKHDADSGTAPPSITAYDVPISLPLQSGFERDISDQPSTVSPAWTNFPIHREQPLSRPDKQASAWSLPKQQNASHVDI